MTETELKREICQALDRMGIFWIRCNSGITKVKRGWMHNCPKGTADLLAIVGGLIPAGHGSDACFCGDYRSQHDSDGCRVCKNMSEPAGGCVQFRFASKASASDVKHWNQYHAKGSPLMLVGPPTPIWIEVKKPKEKQSPEQIQFQSDVEARGMTYIVARSLDDVLKSLRES